MRNSLNEDKDSGAPGSKLAGRKRSGNAVPDCRGPPPGDHPAGEITRTARLAASPAHIPERNILSAESRLLTPFLKLLFWTNFIRILILFPNLKADVSTPPKLAVRTVDSILKSFQVGLCFS